MFTDLRMWVFDTSKDHINSILFLKKRSSNGPQVISDHSIHVAKKRRSTFTNTNLIRSSNDSNVTVSRPLNHQLQMPLDHTESSSSMNRSSVDLINNWKGGGKSSNSPNGMLSSVITGLTIFTERSSEAMKTNQNPVRIQRVSRSTIFSKGKISPSTETMGRKSTPIDVSDDHVQKGVVNLFLV